LSTRGLFVFALIGIGLIATNPATSRGQSVHTLSLEEAINRALGQGEEVGIAQAGIRRAAGNETIAKSAGLPQVSASLGYTRTLQSQYSGLTTSSSTSQDTSGSSSSSSSLFKNLPFGKENQWSLALQASQSIYTGGRISAQRDAAESRMRSAAIDLTAAQAQLVLNVTQSYYDAVLAEQILRIAQDALTQSDEVYKQVKLAYDVGEKSEFEALRAKVSRDNQVPLLVQNENNLAQAQYRLKQLLNLPLDDSLSLTTVVSDSVARFDAMSDTTADARASVLQAKENITSSEAQVRVAESQRMPQVSVSTRYAPVAYPENLFPKFSDFHTDWTVGVNVSVPIYTGGYITGSEDVAKAGVDEAIARLEQTREAAAMDARVAFNDLRAARANLRSTAGTESEARRAYEIARVRYTQGLSTQVELDDSRLQQEQARVNYARAIRNYQVARAKISLLKDLPVNPAQAQVATSSAQSSVTQQSASQPATSAASSSQGTAAPASSSGGNLLGP
jgi:outer membrane protein TolC